MCGPATKPYEVGKFYAVQCVHGAFYREIGWWPVMGEAHRDIEIVNFPWLHYHIDWRFVNERTYRRYVSLDPRGEAAGAFATPLMLMPEDDKPFSRVRRMEDAASEIRARPQRLKCKRQLPSYPHGAAPWMARLSEHYEGACLKRNVCPHRGYDLSREPVVDGVVTCPLHGLRWNVETGARVAPPASSKPIAATAAAGA